MKKLILTFLALASVLTLTACPDKGGGGKNHVTTPNSCNNFRYNHQLGGYEDPRYPGRVVNCNQGPYGTGNNGIYTPYNQYLHGQQINGCSSWSQFYPGNIYVPIQTATYGIVCANVSSFMQVPMYSYYYSYYQRYPTYAASCQYGVNCPSSCIGGSGSMSNSSGLWLGGSLALCFD